MGIIKKSLNVIAETSQMNQWQSTDSYFLLENLEATISLGKALHDLAPNLRLLLLEGPLGAGKTSLVKGIALSLGIKEPITSPTFPLAQHYSSGDKSLFHLDLYRLEDHQAADDLFLQEEEEALSLGALIVVEWPERLTIAIPDAWKINLGYKNDDKRIAQLIPPLAA